MIGKYTEYARIGFMNMLAYRMRYYTGYLTYFINFSVYYFIYKAVYLSGDMELGGLRQVEMISYLAIGWILRSAHFNNIDRQMSYDVIEGRLAISLIRPVNYQLMQFANAAGESLFRLILFTPPITFIIFLVYNIHMPSSPAAAIGFCISVMLSFLVFASINFLIGILAVRFKNIIGVMRAKHFVIQILSGLLIPISVFPEALQRIMDFLPFKCLNYIPSMIYLGKFSGETMVTMIALQTGWAVALFAAGWVAWKRAFAKITIQGG